MRGPRLGFVVFLSLLLVSTPSLAKDKAAARDAFQRGIEHYNLGEYQPALEAFKEAYRNYSDPTFLFNIGQCQRQLGEKRGAIASYKAYLRESPEARNRVEVQSLIGALESAIRDEDRFKAHP